MGEDFFRKIGKSRFLRNKAAQLLSSFGVRFA
jgi:hypothetical protein